jgi:plasmid stability protein
MQIAWLHAQHMSKMIQIRNVPDRVHRTLKARAAQAGTTLSDYLLAELTYLAERPTMDEMLERMARRGDVPIRESPAKAVRAEREARR